MLENSSVRQRILDLHSVMLYTRLTQCGGVYYISIFSEIDGPLDFNETLVKGSVDNVVSMDNISFFAEIINKKLSVCTSTTSSNHVGFFVRRTRVRRTNVRACCIQMSLLSSLAFQIKWCFLQDIQYKLIYMLIFSIKHVKKAKL